MSGTEVGTFDATGYRQRVLATLRGASNLDLSDPFFIVDLPVDVDDAELIRARITALVGFWNKERSPNYKALTAELAKHRADLEAILLDPERRAGGPPQGRAAGAAAHAAPSGAPGSPPPEAGAPHHGPPRARRPGRPPPPQARGPRGAA